MIIAGEASGDMRAAGLARALKTLDPALTMSGIGGEFMRQAGVQCFTDITQLAVIGIAEVVKNFSRIKKVFHQTLKEIDRTRPDGVILVDYPGFNLRLAREIKKRGIKVIYYVSPQVWAWREKRVLKIKQLIDRMIVLFPFEKDVYKKYGMEVDYVGHPLADEVVVNRPQAEVLKACGLSAGKPTIGLLPGSRAREVERHLPCLLEAAQILLKKDPDRQFLLQKAPSIPMPLIEGLMSSYRNLPVKIYEGPTYDGINAMDACLVASGTATLECALLKKPMVIIYKTSWLTYNIARSVIKIPCIGLVNIVAGKKIAEELIQDEANPPNIAEKFEAALKDPQMVDELTAVKASLGQPGASLRAAQVVLDELNSF
jgi:lipid-A-disaccharide synthase